MIVKNNLNFLSILSFMLLSIPCIGQEYDFKELDFTYIKGATKLSSKPEFIKDKNGKPIQIGKLGYAYPTLFDYDKDGKSDLIVGEFLLGARSNLRIYKNIGTNKNPKYNSEFEYFKDTDGELLTIGGL